MRTASWASALLLTAVVVPAVPAAPGVSFDGGTIFYKTEAGETVLEFRRRGEERRSVRVDRDATVDGSAEPSALTVVGSVDKRAVIVADSYPSAPGPMSYCQAGEERFLRVISLAGKRSRETFRIKLASCRDNIELAEPGLAWNPETATLRVRWLAGPGKGHGAEEMTIAIGKDGKAVVKNCGEQR